MPVGGYLRFGCRADLLSGDVYTTLSRGKPIAPFRAALHSRLARNNYNCRQFVFPHSWTVADRRAIDGWDCSGATFWADLVLSECRLSGRSNFAGITVEGGVTIDHTTFEIGALFSKSRFEGPVQLSNCTCPQLDLYRGTFGADITLENCRVSELDAQRLVIKGQLRMKDSTVAESASFDETKTGQGTALESTAYEKVLRFERADFAGPVAIRDCTIGQLVTLRGSRLGSEFRLVSHRNVEDDPLLFKDAHVDFRELMLREPERMALVNVDLRKCRWLLTDLRKGQFTGVQWPRVGRRVGIYDEIVSRSEGSNVDLNNIEHAYRQLKQNREERRDYVLAGDFHYGEKEARRTNPRTRVGLKWLLWIYRELNGYGEQYVRALLAVLILVVGTGVSVIAAGLKGKSGCELEWNPESFIESFEYTIRTILRLKTDEWGPQPDGVDWISLVAATLGPILIGLGGLAIRQQMKR